MWREVISRDWGVLTIPDVGAEEGNGGSAAQVPPLMTMLPGFGLA